MVQSGEEALSVENYRVCIKRMPSAADRFLWGARGFLYMDGAL